MRSEQHEALTEFLADVDEQIRYQPMHAAINEELKAHVEDKAEVYMEYGLEEDQAYRRAVRDMGDASAIGIQMNEEHHPRLAGPLLLLILILMAVGIIGNFADRGFYSAEIISNLYFVWGFAVLLLVMLHGYPLLLKHAGKILVLFLAVGVLWVGSQGMAGHLDGSWLYPRLLFAIYSPSVVFGLLSFAIPAAVILMYRRRHKGLPGLWQVYLFLLAVVLISLISYMVDYTYVPIITLLFSCLAVVIYMVVREYLAVGRWKGIGAAALGFLLLLAVWCGFQGDRFLDNLQMAVHPESQADSAWEDAYNNVVIRDLLGKAELFGKIRLSKEELVRYGTAQWYYEDGPGVWTSHYTDQTPEENFQEYVSYRMQFLEEPKLTDILPQHYLNNYRFAWWILSLGWVPGILLILLNLAAYVLMFYTAFHIKNRLGRLMSFAGSMALSIQFLFYLIGNLGVQFGAFGNLPFVSEGVVSITGSAVMAGLILSAYRFDTVLTEQDKTDTLFF